MHSYEEYQKATQQVINLMKDDYPNGFEMRINKFGAELVNNQTVATYLNEDLIKDYCDTAPIKVESFFKRLFKFNTQKENKKENRI